MIYPPAFEYPYRAGPYTPPRLRPGTVVKDLLYGEVTVEGPSNAPIPWPGFHIPRGAHKGSMPIFFDCLVRAVVEEDEAVVCHYWGVSYFTVNRWRSALAKSDDSNVVFSALTMLRTDPAFRKQYGYV